MPLRSVKSECCPRLHHLPTSISSRFSLMWYSVLYSIWSCVCPCVSPSRSHVSYVSFLRTLLQPLSQGLGREVRLGSYWEQTGLVQGKVWQQKSSVWNIPRGWCVGVGVGGWMWGRGYSQCRAIRAYAASISGTKTGKKMLIILSYYLAIIY